jgi:hypothetical protein
MSRISVLSHVRSLLLSFLLRTDRLASQRPIAMLILSGETESGSAGKQPDKGYPDRRCAKGVSGPWRLELPGAAFRPHLGHRSHAFKNPYIESPFQFPGTEKDPAAIRARSTFSFSLGRSMSLEAPPAYVEHWHRPCSAMLYIRGHLLSLSILSFFYCCSV